MRCLLLHIFLLFGAITALAQTPVHELMQAYLMNEDYYRVHNIRRLDIYKQESEGERKKELRYVYDAKKRSLSETRFSSLETRTNPFRFLGDGYVEMIFPDVQIGKGVLKFIHVPPFSYEQVSQDIHHQQFDPQGRILRDSIVLSGSAGSVKRAMTLTFSYAGDDLKEVLVRNYIFGEKGNSHEKIRVCLGGRASEPAGGVD